VSRRRGGALLALGVLGIAVGSISASAGATLPPSGGDGSSSSSLPVASTTPASAASSASIGAIRHVVVVVEQNHTFDSYFGRYPGVDGLTGVAAPLLPGGQGERATFTDYSAAAVDTALAGRTTEALDSSQTMADRVLANGTDQLLLAQAAEGHAWQLATTVHTAASAAPLWSVAKSGVLFDHYFSSEPGGTVRNVLSLLTGTTVDLADGGGDTLKDLRDLKVPTVFDELQQAGHSWKYYVGDLAKVDGPAVVSGKYLRPDATPPAALTWAPVLGMRRFWDDAALSSNFADQEQLYVDAAQGRLPDVSFVLPQPTDHPNSAGDVGQTRLLSVLNAVTSSPNWDSTAVFVVWDDWGGMFDHVTPPAGRGSRVPMILLSPWVTPGTIASESFDHLSVLNFIVRQFGLASMSARQDAAKTFDRLFVPTASAAPVFSKVPLPRGPVGTGHQNALTLALYALAFFATIGFFVWVWRRPSPGGRGRDDDDDEPLVGPPITPADEVSVG